jgi:hypothetical protein
MKRALLYHFSQVTTRFLPFGEHTRPRVLCSAPTPNTSGFGRVRCTDFLPFGEHTRPRVLCSAPSPNTSGFGRVRCTDFLLFGEHTRPRVLCSAPTPNTSSFGGVRRSDYLCKLALLILALLLCSGPLRAQTNDQRTLVLVVGAPGEPQYSEQFSAWADLWKQAAAKGGLSVRVIGQDETGASPDDKTRLLNILAEEVARPAGELWVVFIGHGTYDGHTAKFNLRGPDLSAEELAAALKPCRRPLVIVQGASASGPFLPILSAPGRVIITSTRSGYEENFARFGGYLARALADPAADLDHDGQISLLEAFLLAARQTDQFYRDDGRLMTEHPLLDDNGDGLGTPPEWFQGVRAVKTPEKGKSVDGVRAHQMILARGHSEQELLPEARARRDQLEIELSALRSKKTELNEDEYYRQLEKLMVETARLYSDQQTN